MVSGEQGRRLRPVPFRIVRTAEGVVLKRAATEIALIGEGAAALIEALVAAAAGGATRDEICEQFPAPERAFVANLVDQLVTSRLLQEASGSGEPSVREDHVDLLYWQLGTSAHEVTERLDRAGIGGPRLGSYLHKETASARGAGRGRFGNSAVGAIGTVQAKICTGISPD